jgi:zinc protease
MARAQKVSLASPVSGISVVQTLQGITEYTLDSNGLQILLIPDTSVPITGCMITYHVGSRNEATGYTGATHLLEHLMFKESKNFNESNGKPLKEYLQTRGAIINATTWFDRTNYYQIMPSSILAEAIELEADRMRNLILTEKDRSAEMPVVRNEFERGENLPAEAIDKQVWATAFQAHPYHHSTIGWRTDIEKVSIERLQQFYDDFYWPDNATISIVGDFDTKNVLEKIKKEFGQYSRAPRPYPLMYTSEPPQEGERRTIVKRAGVNMITIAHKIPEALHADIPALIVLGTILSDDKTSRLYRAFVDTSKATDATTFCYQLRDPALFQTFITLSEGVTHTGAEKLLKAEYEKVKTKGITAAELARAKRSFRAYLATRRDGAYALLSSLNEDIATGDWRQFVTLPEKLAAVTAAEVKAVANKYLIDDQSTVGWFINTAH